MDVLLERCAGIDIGKDEVVACVRTPGPGGRGRRKDTRTFRSFVGDLEAMAAWFVAEGVADVAMEARLARRIGKKKAAIAVGHSILVICWHLITNDTDYEDLGSDCFARRNDPDRHRDRLIQQLHGLGYRVTLVRVA